MWIKSSQCSSGECVEVEFATSSQCQNITCVEVAIPEGRDVVIVRNSQSPGKSLVFDRFEWAAFIKGAKLGEFDV